MILFLPSAVLLNTGDITNGKLLLHPVPPGSPPDTKPELKGLQLIMRNGRDITLPSHDAALVLRQLENDNEISKLQIEMLKAHTKQQSSLIRP